MSCVLHMQGLDFFLSVVAYQIAVLMNYKLLLLQVVAAYSVTTKLKLV